MPHWGMSLALGTNINDTAPAERLKQAHTHLAEAEKRKAAGSDVEQGLVAALGKRYVADPAGDQMRARTGLLERDGCAVEDGSPTILMWPRCTRKA